MLVKRFERSLGFQGIFLKVSDRRSLCIVATSWPAALTSSVVSARSSGGHTRGKRSTGAIASLACFK